MMEINMLNPSFYVGFAFGFIIASVVIDILWYLYWERELHPMLVFYEQRHANGNFGLDPLNDLYEPKEDLK